MRTKETLYNTYVNAQKDNFEKVAIYKTDGKAVTHGQLLEEADRVAAAMLEYKKNDRFVIGIISITSYREAVFLLAANKIGAVIKFIDVTKTISEIHNCIIESSVSVIVIGEQFLPMAEHVNPEKKPVVLLSDNEVKIEGFITYSELLKKGEGKNVDAVPYKDGKGTVIINSTGTTGIPKPIVLSDYAINNAVMKMKKTDYPLIEGNLLLKAVPAFIGMGLITSLYTGLIVGTPIIYIGGNDVKDTIEHAVEFFIGFNAFVKSNGISPDAKLLIFGFPMYYRALTQFIEPIEDLSFIKCMLAGGSAMTKEELEIMDKVFSEKGCSVPILNGYGQNEMAGAVALNRIGKNRRGSAGIPVDGTEIRIVDLKTGKKLGTNEKGKILECSESLFLEYENMEEKTKASYSFDDNGKKWFDTNDIGYIDDDGFLFITGRSSRVIIRYDLKISLDKIEAKIRESMYVKEAGIISLGEDGNDGIVAFVTLKDEYKNDNISEEDILNNIQKGANPLTEFEIPNKMIIIDSMPYRSSGKIDYLTLEKQAEEMSK